MWRGSVALVLALSAFAGCIGDGNDLDNTGGASLSDVLAAASEPLWVDPQDYPHPAYGFPTLTNPATGPEVPEFWAPIPARELPATLTGITHLAAAGDEVEAGAGMAMFGSIAVIPGFGEPNHILDVSDPEHPVVLSEFEEQTRGTAIIAYPDGRLVAVFSTDHEVIVVYDITDPTNPVKLPDIDPPTGSHKLAVVPGTPILYNAASKGGGRGTGNIPGLGTGTTEIYDLSDPDNAVLVQEFQNGYSCHHIYMYVNPADEHYRALCAGIQYTQIWDITDPLAPEVIVWIPVHHGIAGTPSTSAPSRFSHSAMLNADHTVLIVGDETGGGALPPGCDVHAEVPDVGGVSGVIGNLYFYDVTDESRPVLLGWFNPGQSENSLSSLRSCTAHHGRVVPDPEGRDLIAWGFYAGGVVLLDISNPTLPVIVDQWNDGADVWEVWYNQGYLFTGDLARGMDVLTFE